MKQYILGYYCRDAMDLKTLNKDSNSDILDSLREAYPSGLTAHQLAEKTGIPINTIYAQSNDLWRESFIVKLDNKDQPRPRGRPSEKTAKNSPGQRPREEMVIEDANSLFNIYKGKSAGKTPLPPGNVEYSDEFVDAWHKIVGKEEEDELCKVLLRFLEKMFRRTSESDDDKIREIAPTKKWNFVVHNVD